MYGIVWETIILIKLVYYCVQKRIATENVESGMYNNIIYGRLVRPNAELNMSDIHRKQAHSLCFQKRFAKRAESVVVTRYAQELIMVDVILCHVFSIML